MVDQFQSDAKLCLLDQVLLHIGNSSPHSGDEHPDVGAASVDVGLAKEVRMYMTILVKKMVV